MSQNAQQLSLTAIAELPAIAPLPEQEISTEVLVEKYAKGAETNVHDVRRRVAKALAANEEEKQRAKWEERFLWAQENGFVPAHLFYQCLSECIAKRKFSTHMQFLSILKLVLLPY